MKELKDTCQYKKYEPNGTKEEVMLGILHNENGYYISNEGSKQKPSYHVWIPDIACAKCDSAYNNITLAVARCNYLAKHKVKMRYSHCR